MSTDNTASGITGVDFIALPTRDIEVARNFYGEVLGLEEGKQWGSMPAYEFEAGDQTIALMQSDAFRLEFSPHTHPFALQVDDVEAARADLEAKGVAFDADTLDSGVCFMAFFRDPDGNGLMLHQRYAQR